MNRAALHNLIEAYQEAWRWILQAEGLQHKLQTQDERELSRKKVQTLERDLSVLRYNLMCESCRHYWDTLNDGRTFEVSCLECKQLYFSRLCHGSCGRNVAIDR